MKTAKLLALCAAIMAVPACTEKSAWSVSGVVEGAPQGTAMAVEANNAGRWYVLDSVATDKNGNFEYRASEVPSRPEIMRLTLPGKGSIYFPADSATNVTVRTSADGFASAHSLGGSEAAGKMSQVDSLCRSGKPMEELRRELVGYIINDTTGIVAYYTVGKTIGNVPVFDANESFGNRAYGAAAQVFASYRPDDTRGKALLNTYVSGRSAMGKLPAAEEKVIELESRGLFDIDRYDNKGVRHSLVETAKPGKVVLLSFTAYTADGSPDYNRELFELYSKYHDKGLEIYQIAFDEDEVAWKEAAANLPWITVWNSPAEGRQPLLDYNVGALPMTFVIDRNGDLRKRVANRAELPSEVAKLF